MRSLSRTRLGLGVFSALPLFLSGCSYLPDSVNPTTWNWSRLNPVSWFESEPPKPQQATKAAATQRSTLAERPGAQGNKPFPSVNDTPAKPTPAPPLERRNLAQGLQADRDNARYTDETLRASASQAAPPPSAIAAAPGPAAPTRPPAAEPPTPRQQPAPAVAQVVPPSLPSAAPPPAAVPAAAVPAPSMTGGAPAQRATSRTTAVPVPPSVPPSPAPLTTPVGAAPTLSVVPAQPSGAAPAASQIAQAPPSSLSGSAPSNLPSRPGAQVSPSGPAALPSGFVPGGGRTPLLAMVYSQSIAAQNARSVAEIPSGFQSPGAQPIGQFATDLPPIVQQSFNTGLAQMPPNLTPTGMAARGASVGAALIHFQEGSTRLDPNTRNLLEGAVAQQRERGGLLRVVGHANGQAPRESKKRSLDISQGRAQVVARELIKLGAPAASVVTEALGDSRPIFDESTPAGAAENRRVEIYLE